MSIIVFTNSHRNLGPMAAIRQLSNAAEASIHLGGSRDEQRKIVATHLSSHGGKRRGLDSVCVGDMRRFE
jgi:hypothetical protein